MTRRSALASRSISAVIIPSMESGRPSTEPAFRAACTSSCRNRGFPPDRSLSSTTSCGGNGESSVAMSIRWLSELSDRGVRCSDVQRAATGATKPVSSSRRLTQMSHGTSLIRSAIIRRRSAEPPSIQCASSITTRVGALITAS